jgi:hypothetical protein
MHFLIFLLMYGMLALSGVFLAIYWGFAAARRIKAVGPVDVRMDRVFWIASSLAINNFGLAILAAGRAWTNSIYGPPSDTPGSTGFVIGTGLMVILLAQVMMVWLADLERARPLWLWGMTGISLLWSLVCVALVR